MFSTSQVKSIPNFVNQIGFTSVMAVEKHKTLSERLKTVAKHYNLSIAELCRQLNVPTTTMHGYLNENREPKMSFFQEVVKTFPEINIAWLISGIGNMFNPVLYVQDLEKELTQVNEQLAVYRKLDKAHEEIASLKNKQ